MTKPSYRVPTMDEIRAIPPNGLTVASTFSGAGGSCTGYRMAGYRVVWANEFVPAAQSSYKANADPSCILDPRDVRTVTADDILTATGLARGELDLFDGSPPCQAFSMAGKRAKGWGKERHYEHGAHQKNEDLFFEYIRLLDGLQPRTFVAENVSGLVKGVAKGYFLDILKGLKACGYRVTCRVLDAQWLGVPQCRQRAIFIGVREDLGLDPVHPKPLLYRYSVRDALPELVAGMEVISGNDAFSPQWAPVEAGPSPTIMAVTDKKFHSYGLSFNSNLTESNDFFEPRSWGAVFIRPQNIRYGTWISSNYQKRLALDINAYHTAFLNRNNWDELDLLFSVRWRMNNKIFLIASYSQNIANNEQGFAIRNFGSNPFPNDILFSERNKRTSISTIDLRYTITNRMGITFRLRHYWAKVDYNQFFTLNENGRLDPLEFDGLDINGVSIYNTNYNAFTIDMVFRWIYAPASEINIVWKNAVFNQNDLTQLNYFTNIQDMFERNPLNSFSVRFIYFFDTVYIKKLANRKTV